MRGLLGAIFTICISFGLFASPEWKSATISNNPQTCASQLTATLDPFDQSLLKHLRKHFDRLRRASLEDGRHAAAKAGLIFLASINRSGREKAMLWEEIAAEISTRFPGWLSNSVARGDSSFAFKGDYYGVLFTESG